MKENNLNKYSFMLLFGLGISNLGDFIYLVAINVLVFKITGSATAVAGLWIIGPIAALITKFWMIPFIDRMNLKKILIFSDLFRGSLLIILPLISSLWIIYTLLFLLAVGKSFFEVSSMTYITKLVPENNRKKFNSFRSLLTSGAFLIGPAVSGILLLIASPGIAIWINAFSFFLSAIIIYLLPNIDSIENNKVFFTLKAYKSDWNVVTKFSKEYKFVFKIYLFTQLLVIFSLAMDAQEVVFTQDVLNLSEAQYGILISLTGLGSIIGASVVSILSNRLSNKMLIGGGSLLVTAGYIIYSLSNSFNSVMMAFLILGFFSSFSNTGFMTFYQSNVPVNIMGRISSVYGLLQSGLQIGCIFLVGFTGDIIPIRFSIIACSIIMLIICIVQMFLINQKKNNKFFIEKEELKITS